MRLFWLCAFLLLSTSSLAQWDMILPPDFQRGSLLTAIPYCKKQQCFIIVAFTTGEIYEVNTQTRGLTTLRVANDLVASLAHTSASYSTALTYVAVSGAQNTLYAAASDGTYYYTSLNDAPLARVWQKFVFGVAATHASIIIPVTSPQSNDIVAIFDNSFIVMQNVFYGKGIVLGNYPSNAKPTVSLYSDWVTPITGGGYVIQNLIMVGLDTGFLYTVVASAGKTSAYTFGVGGGKVASILHYKTAQKNQWIIFSTVDATTAANNRLVMVDLNNGNTVKQFSAVANAMTLYSDLLLKDWIVFANATGIYKVDVARLASSGVFSPISISTNYNAYGTSGSNIVRLETSFIQTLDANRKLVKVPCVLAASSTGQVSALRADSSDWIQLANPLEFVDVGNNIATSYLVGTAQGPNQTFAVLAALDYGGVLLKVIDDVQFLKGLPDNSVDGYIYQQAVTQVNVTRGGYSTGALSFIQLTSLLEQGKIILLSFVDSAGKTLQYQLIGFEEQSNPLRKDSQKLIIQLANTVSSQEAMEAYDLDLDWFPALQQAVYVLYDVSLFGVDLLEIGNQFVYSATQIFDPASQ